MYCGGERGELFPLTSPWYVTGHPALLPYSIYGISTVACSIASKWREDAVSCLYYCNPAPELFVCIQMAGDMGSDLF